MKSIILASQSPRRSELLRQINMPFVVQVSTAPENINSIKGTPEQKAQQLALMKARNVASTHNEGIVIGADTIVVLDNTIMGKPSDENEAFLMLKCLSGRQHRVITGLALIDAATGLTRLDYEATLVSFKKVTDDAIQSYISTGEPYGKAGAYGIQGIGAVLVEKIDGCYSNVVGLPLSKLSSMLEEFQVFVL
jgi:septum formation protein